jgi:protocatechuate 3,4-dioxygenase alpha subunit
MRGTTPPQTIGPFFAVLLPDRGLVSILPPGSPGPRVTVAGTVADGDGAPVSDALVEIWQGGAGLHGFGRTPTDGAGGFAFETIKPGPVPGPDDRTQAPHLVVGLSARGLLTRLVTRVYFDDEPANEHDPRLMCVPPHRRATLISVGEGAGRYRFDIVLQGPRETVFFDV